MKQNIPILKKMSAFFLAVFLMVAWGSEVMGQQNVFSRDSGSSNWWSDSNHPWFYETWITLEPRPDYFPIGTRNDVVIGHNNNLTMSVNGATFNLRSLNILSSSNRTFNTSSSGRININTHLTNGSAATHTFNVSIDIAGAVSFNASNTSGTMIFQRSLVLGNNTLTFTGSGNNQYDGNNGTISGTGSIVKDGSGRLDISGGGSSGPNTYSGGTEFRQGIIRIGNNQPLGTGTVLIHWEHTATPLVFASRSGTARTIANNFNLYYNLTIGQTSGGTGSITFTGDFHTGGEVGDQRVLTINNNHEISGDISGLRGITKEGTGNLTLSGTNTFTGPTVVNAGTLQIGNDFASSSITINDGGTFRVTGTETNSITVQDGGTLEIATGATLTIRENETLTINSGGTVDMKGNLIVLGTLVINDGATLVVPSGRNLVASNITYNGTGAIEFRRALTTANRWVVMSSPVAGNFAGTGGLFRNIWTQGFPGSNNNSSFAQERPNVVLFDETEEGSFDARYFAPVSNSIPAGRGFFVYLYPEDEIGGNPVNFGTAINITGSQIASNADFNFNVTYTENANPEIERGWNLIGNPWGAGIEWNAANWNAPHMNAFIYRWNPNTGLTEAIENNVGHIISPFQGFYVKAENTSASLQLTPGARRTEPSTHVNSVSEMPIVNLEFEMGDLNSNARLRFDDYYEFGLDYRDAYFMAPMSSSFAAVYSVVDGAALNINSLPLTLDEAITIPIIAGGYVDAQLYDGPAAFNFDAMNIPSDWTVTLRDNLTGEVIDLTTASRYEFSFSTNKSAQPLEDISELRQGGSPVMKADAFEYRFEVTVTPQTTSAPINGELPSVVSLGQNYPNPFNPTTQITYELPQAAEVRLDVFNIQGQRVATLVNASQNAGVHTVTFDAANVSSGVYVYRLQAGATVLTRKMTLVK